MNFQTMNRKALGLFLPVLISIFVLGGISGCTPTNATVIPDLSQYNPDSEEFLLDWNNDADSKQTIINFVNRVTTPGPDFVEVADRIAVFDNDGTLWSEKPIYFPIKFELKKKAQQESFIDSTTDEYIEEARHFVYEENQRDFGVPYRTLVYKPVIGLVDYLKANGFKVYICSGGDIDFVRSFSYEAYGIPPEEVIGTAVITEFDAASGNVLRKSDFLDGFENPDDLAQYNDQEGKPVGIENHIGKRPIIAVGNSSGDFEMFQYTDTGVNNSLIVLINHDDCEQEYEYNNVPFATNEDGEPLNESLDYAQNHENWLVASMKDDFNTIFASNPSKRFSGCE
ncbi:MAG: haloacid dehalogenase-like hydrolase [Crocosphaera sp.]|nr:haloacid dehalogenase-like hydrolase [Crocosphaera sp.]